VTLHVHDEWQRHIHLMIGGPAGLGSPCPVLRLAPLAPLAPPCAGARRGLIAPAAPAALVVAP
jgi:hypothetical protein